MTGFLLALTRDALIQRLEIAQATGVSKVVYCSTIGLFGDTKGTIINETFQRTQTNFSSAYDRTKYEAQQLVAQFAAQGLPVVSILPSRIFGADDPHFSPVMQQFIKGGLKLWAGGDRITGIVHVDDLVAAMILAAEKGRFGEHYIISAGDLTTREIFTLLSQETGVPVPFKSINCFDESLFWSHSHSSHSDRFPLFLCLE